MYLHLFWITTSPHLCILLIMFFRCDKCEFATALKRNLERHHIRVHSHIKPFSCPMQGCGYQVNNSIVLACFLKYIKNFLLIMYFHRQQKRETLISMLNEFIWVCEGTNAIYLDVSSKLTPKPNGWNIWQLNIGT